MLLFYDPFIWPRSRFHTKPLSSNPLPQFAHYWFLTRPHIFLNILNHKFSKSNLCYQNPFIWPRSRFYIKPLIVQPTAPVCSFIYVKVSIQYDKIILIIEFIINVFDPLFWHRSRIYTKHLSSNQLQPYSLLLILDKIIHISIYGSIQSLFCWWKYNSTTTFQFIRTIAWKQHMQN